MRTAYKVWTGIAAGVFCLVAATDLSGGVARWMPAARTSTTTSVSAGSSGDPIVTIDASAHPGSDAVVTGPVTRIVDGDTLEVAGERIRVLGIDACETGTVGGDAARARAQALLGGRTVALRQEPGVDRDHDGRELRYVELDGRDFGLAMVAHPDTGVYRGRNEVAASYLTQLRAADADGRTCAGPSPSTTASHSSSRRTTTR